MMPAALLVAACVSLGACASKPKPAPVAPLAQPELGAANIEQTARGPMLTLDDVLFDFDRAELRPGAMPLLEQAATYLKDNPGHVAQVEGHADSIGDAAYNQQLSVQRSNIVRTALVSAGVPASKIAVAAFGEERPVAPNDSAQGRQANRRVEILFKER